MNLEIVVASNNKNKVNEIRSILSPHKITVYGLSDLNLLPEKVIENGSSYKDNALIKALAVSKLTKLPILSDDSGLEVLSMNNQPGIYTARFAEQCGGYPQAMSTIINNVKNKDRSAKFICDIVVLNIENKPLFFEGIAEGEIAETPEGINGFGFDPIFISKEANKNFALLTSQEKNTISHRAKALKKLITYLQISKLAM